MIGYGYSFHQENHATLGSCLAAVTIAQQHDNEWQETAFTPDECAVIAGKIARIRVVVCALENYSRCISEGPHVANGSVTMHLLA